MRRNERTFLEYLDCVCTGFNISVSDRHCHTYSENRKYKLMFVWNTVGIQLAYFVDLLFYNCHKPLLETIYQEVYEADK